ncbi:MAG: hypothetical protein Rubg2KO_23290 [Rubricoccaceae bacterium]
MRRLAPIDVCVVLALVAMSLAACQPSASEPPVSSDSSVANAVGVERVGVEGLPASLNLTFPSIDPVTGDVWFSVYDDSFDDQAVMRAERMDTGWGIPDTVGFSGQWGDRAPRFSPDGSSLYITSNRPREEGGEAGDMNVWMLERTDDGWGDPALVLGAVNSPEQDIHASPTDLAVWVASNRESSLGRSDIYRIGMDGEVEHIADPINDEGSQPDLWVSPDESWMILVMTDHADGFGGDDLYLVERTGEGWAVPVNLGPEVNSEEYEYGPSLSPDGQLLYFTSHRDGESRVYRVSLASVRQLGEDQP